MLDELLDFNIDFDAGALFGGAHQADGGIESEPLVADTLHAV
jgi:hypothetical protein